MRTQIRSDQAPLTEFSPQPTPGNSTSALIRGLIVIRQMLETPAHKLDQAFDSIARRDVHLDGASESLIPSEVSRCVVVEPLGPDIGCYASDRVRDGYCVRVLLIPTEAPDA